MKYLLCLLLCLSAANTAWAQSQKPVKLETAGVKLPAGVPLDTINKILRATELLLDRYNLQASLLDPTTTPPTVTRQSVRAFNSLFIGNAKLFKDYAANPTDILMNAGDYADEVYYFLPNEGLAYEIKSALLTEIGYDSAGFYQPKIVLEKVMYNFVSTDGMTRNLPNGKLYELTMLIDIPIEDLTRAKIGEIKNNDDIGGIFEDYERYMGIAAHGSFLQVSGTASSYYSDNAAALAALETPRSPGDISLSASPAFGLGFYWKSNRLAKASKKHKPLFLTAGAQASFFTIKTQLDQYSISNFEALAWGIGNEKQDYTRIVDEVNTTQEDGLFLLDIPVGLSLRLKKTAHSAYFLNLQFVPQIAVVTSSSLSGTARYDGYISKTHYRFLEEMATNPPWLNTPPSDPNNPIGAYHVGNEVPLNYNNTSLKTGLGYSIRLSPEAYFDRVNRNPLWGILVGLDLSFNLKSPIQHAEPDGQPLAFETNAVKSHEQDGLTDSIFQSMYKSSRFSNIGLRFGIYRKLSTKVDR